MDPPQDFKSLQDQIQAALISTTKTAGQISSEDLNFQRSLDPAVGTALDEQSTRLLGLVSDLLKSAASLSQLDAPPLEDIDDVDNNWKNVVDVVDSLLEKADICVDEYTGVIKRRTSPTNDREASKPAKKQHPGHNLGNSYRNQNLLKPQLKFNVKPDNDDNTPWKPLLASKPHAVIPLNDSLRIFTDELQHQQYLHPYELEIQQLKYPDAVYKKADPISYHPPDTTSATFVDTWDGVLDMLAALKSAREIAVDLEHHDARTYVGLVSLMQISTREKDWIVDTLKPWRQDLQILNEVFADPSIVKVFHGAYMDIVWLQRDLGLYVVGLFDTYHACRVLGYPGGSLAYLLKRFVDFDADKQYQMADWRIRPLPDEMFFYARADTHYLLYIYDNLRNELVEKSDRIVPEENRIELVLQKSKETSLLRHERQIYDENGMGPGGWFNILAKSPSLFTNEQFAVFRAIHAWRDKIARKDDESTNYVMPNHVLFLLAKLMPMDSVALFAAIRSVSHNVKSRVTELMEVIKAAKLTGAEGPSMMEVLRPGSVGPVAKSGKSAAISVPEGPTGEAAIFPGDEFAGSRVSKFWGNAFGSSIWDPPPPNAGGLGLRLSVPLPPVASEAFVSVIETPTKVQTEQISSTLVTKESVDDEVFNLKAGKKRKSEALTDSKTRSPIEPKPSSEYDISLNDEDDEEARKKAARKAEKKAEKRRRKLEKEAGKGITAADTGDVEENREEEKEKDFDYSKAESVLHGKRREIDPAVGGKRKNPKPFDPYAKSADAPKGMRRLQTERAGKSFTFKS